MVFILSQNSNICKEEKEKGLYERRDFKHENLIAALQRGEGGGGKTQRLHSGLCAGGPGAPDIQQAIAEYPRRAGIRHR